MARILIYGINYAPEMAGVGRYTGEIGDYFHESDHDLTVVTAVPHYPGWKVQPPYPRRAYMSERRGGAKIVRCPLVLRENMHGIWRLIAPFSFAVTSAPVVFWQILRRRPEIVICVEPTLFAAPVAIIAARFVGARTVLQVQDLEVDACFAVGHLEQKAWLKRIGFAFERIVLRGFDQLITISGKMAERLAQKGVEADKIAIVRNWVDLDLIKPLDGPSPYRRELGIDVDDFVVLYSGNIGAKQGFNDLMDAAVRLEPRRDIAFVIAGEGPAKSDLQARLPISRTCVSCRFSPIRVCRTFLGWRTSIS